MLLLIYLKISIFLTLSIYALIIYVCRKHKCSFFELITTIFQASYEKENNKYDEHGDIIEEKSERINVSPKQIFIFFNIVVLLLPVLLIVILLVTDPEDI